MCTFSFYMETKILIRLNIFDTEDFLVSLLDPKKQIHEKTSGIFLEDFALCGKFKFY